MLNIRLDNLTPETIEEIKTLILYLTAKSDSTSTEFSELYKAYHELKDL